MKTAFRRGLKVLLIPSWYVAKNSLLQEKLFPIPYSLTVSLKMALGNQMSRQSPHLPLMFSESWVAKSLNCLTFLVSMYRGLLVYHNKIRLVSFLFIQFSKNKWHSAFPSHLVTIWYYKNRILLLKSWNGENKTWKWLTSTVTTCVSSTVRHQESYQHFLLGKPMCNFLLKVLNLITCKCPWGNLLTTALLPAVSVISITWKRRMCLHIQHVNTVACKFSCSEDGVTVKFAAIGYLLAEIMFLGSFLDSAHKVLLCERILAIILVFCPITKPWFTLQRKLCILETK